MRRAEEAVGVGLGGMRCSLQVLVLVLAWAMVTVACREASLAVPGRGEVSPGPPLTVTWQPSATAPTPAAKGPLLFDGRLAYEHALAQCALGPRPTGSAAGRATGDYIIQSLRASGWDVETGDFRYEGVAVRNVIGRQGGGEGAPVGIIGAHYDTRRLADRDPNDPSQPLPGGNDGASGVAVLLELARVWSGADLPGDVWLAFFDAEDNGHIDGWPWSVGATHLAENLTVMPAWVIVADMVGDTDQQFYYERNSDPALMEQLWGIAAGLGYAEHFVPTYKWTITDDHVPFLQRGIRAVDLIDFDYPYWHTAEDTCDKVSPESLERVGRVLQRFVEGGEIAPQ